MKVFKTALINTAAQTKVQLTGEESPNEAKLKTLKTFIDTGVDVTEGNGFTHNAFKLYQKLLSEVEVTSANPLAGAQYKQLRFMIDGIQNLVEVTTPEQMSQQIQR